jgi:predicted nucleic acid-binding OB-fold protein
LQRYLKSATPLVSEAELVSTQKAMTEFVTGVGGKLHKEIVEREKKRYSSFITDPTCISPIVTPYHSI